MVMCSDLAGMQAIIPLFSCHRNKKETPRAKKLLALLTLVYLLQLHERIPSCSSIQIMSLAILLSRPSVAGQSSRDLGDYMVLVQDHMRSGSSPSFFQDSKIVLFGWPQVVNTNQGMMNSHMSDAPIVS